MRPNDAATQLYIEVTPKRLESCKSRCPLRKPLRIEARRLRLPASQNGRLGNRSGAREGPRLANVGSRQRNTAGGTHITAIRYKRTVILDSLHHFFDALAHIGVAGEQLHL